MVNIQSGRIIDYGSGQTVTVYFDDVETKMFYIVPSPRIVVDIDGAPHFSLTKYVKNDGKVAGLCAFDVELAVPPDALKAVKNTLPADNYQGQLTYLSANSYFFYDIAGEMRVAAGTGSMYGANRVSYSVQLASDTELTSFVNAFRGHGSLSSYRVAYDAVVLTRLPEVSVTVTYNPDIAITYETQYVTPKDMWGQKHQVASGVKQYLRDSGAGDVQVTWSTQPSDETRQRVYDWGFTTLETLVADALNTAIAQSGGKSPVSFVGEIVRTYGEKEVVEWSFNTSQPLMAYDEETWEKYVYKEVDVQQLAVQFGLLGEFTKNSDGAAIVSKVQITVQYPTKTSGNSFDLTLAKTSNLYTAPGDFTGGTFNNKYSYRYEVFFTGGTNPFLSDWIESTATIVDILPNELGIRQAAFVGSNIPFTPPPPNTPVGVTVDKLMIDFFFLRPAGQPNKVESKVMTANGEGGKISFSSLFNLPLTNTYTYRYTFQMSDGTTFIMEPTDQFGSANKDMLMVLNPFRENTFLLRATVKKKKAAGAAPKAPSIDNVFFDARYIDKLNKADLNNNYDWDPPANSTSGLASAEAWKYRAIYNPEGAYYEFNGMITYSDGDATVNNLKIQAVQSQLKLSPDDEPYSIQVDGSIVDWTVVDKVDVFLFQSASPLPESAAKQLLTPRVRGMVEDIKVSNPLRYPLLKPETQQVAEDARYYLIQRPRTDSSISFYYSATYIHADGTLKYVEQVEVKNQFVLILPTDGTSDEPVLSKHVLNFPAKSRTAV